MSRGHPLLTIDKDHYVVKLHKDTLEVDFKSGARKALESAVERRPGLRDSVGLLFQAVIPLDVNLHSIRDVKVDKEGQVKIAIPRRKDIAIKLDPVEAKRLVDMLHKLMPEAKSHHLHRVGLERAAMGDLERSHLKARRYVTHR